MGGNGRRVDSAGWSGVVCNAPLLINMTGYAPQHSPCESLEPDEAPGDPTAAPTPPCGASIAEGPTELSDLCQFSQRPVL